MTKVVDDGVAAGAAVEGLAEEPSALDAHGLRQRSLVTGPVSRALVFLALPVLGEQFLNLFVGLTDTYLAGTISKDATAAIGLTTMVEWLVGLMFGFIGTGATALVSRHAGAGDREGANHFANQSFAASSILGIFAAAFVLIVAPHFARLQGWTGEPARIATLYFHVDGWGYTLYAMTVIGNACLRGMGDTRTPLYVMCAVNLVNIGVSTTLRFGFGPIPELGVLGVIIGTLSARVLGGLLVLTLLIRGRSHLKLQAAQLRFRLDSMRRILHVGVPAGIDGALLWAGQFLFLMIISRLGKGGDQSAIVAAHFVGIKIEALSYLPAFAWATAAATLVGQSLGAKDPNRALRCGHFAAIQSSILCFVMSIFYYVFAHEIYAWFNDNPDLAAVSAIGVPALRALAFFQIPLACCIVYVNALRGAGDTRYPLLFTVIGMVGVRLPLAYLGGIVLERGLLGAWVGMFADMLVRAILNTVRFSRARWARIQV